MDDNYQTYLNRVARMTLPEVYISQVQNIQQSPKYQPSPSGRRQAAPFPGYTIITLPRENDSENSTFYTQIENFQQELMELSFGDNFIILVPKSSFHLTLANLIWDNAYADACEKHPDFHVELKSCFADIFAQYENSKTINNSPIYWQMLGLTITPRALRICLIPKDKESYEQIINLRRIIYQNSKLMKLGIEQQYDFTAHVTLGYFGEIPKDLDKELLSTKLTQLNHQWTAIAPELLVHSAELRKFDDMTRYYRESDFPRLDF